ncbi:MAG: [FeFe] hydrogenase H-cluster radical SAM maturase HydG [Spirochaetota bacterium]
MTQNWEETVIRQDEIDRYLIGGRDFIDEDSIQQTVEKAASPDPSHIDDILAKSLQIERLTPEETAALLNVTDEETWKKMFTTALEVKRKVYDNRIVFFAPLYCSNLCVNGCRYCGFRSDNEGEVRRRLDIDEMKRETSAMLAEGHKRMIIVFGEHPTSDIDYMCEAMRAVYSVHEKSPNGTDTSIRRINVNAAPMSVGKLKKLHAVGIGTYQVFQETYHRGVYGEMHPRGPKADYRWRLYALHRAMEAGIDDLGAGALFGLYDWRFEVMGLVHHAIDLETHFGIGPHTVSFPRLTPASGSSVPQESRHLVNDDDFIKLITVLRLAIPYTGLIVTAREKPSVRRQAIMAGCTQTDASTHIGIGSYSNRHEQSIEKQQFMLGDTRTLDEVARELAEMGMITSFCTAGYRCGRTGDKIMKLLHDGTEGKFCKLNAVLTYREFLDDYASPETKAAGETVIAQELSQIEKMDFYRRGKILSEFHSCYEKVRNGTRDLYI